MTVSKRRLATAGVAVISAGGLALSATAGAAPATTSGPIEFLGVTVGVNGSPHDVVTGAITDVGTDRTTNARTQTITLKRGSFQVDVTKLNKSFTFKPNKIGCSGVALGVGRNMAISHGTGAYAAITGSVTIEATFIQIGKVTNGKCNLKKGVAGNGTVIGAGHVSY